jgi:hypothetical protein
VVVNSLEVVDRQIVAKLRAHAPTDPLCCPSQEITRRFSLNGQTLRLDSETQP